MEMNPHILLPLSPVRSSSAIKLSPRVTLSPEVGWGTLAPWI